MKSPEYYRGKEQTYIKHFFLERYLQTLAFHIGYSQKELVYVDCFSGPWRSQDEQFGDTSIRIALDTLNFVREALAAKERLPKIRALFVEKSPDAFTALRSALDTHSGGIETTAFNGDFENTIPRIIEAARGSFAFFFIDPTGWGFAMDRIAPLVKHEPSEVIVNFMYDFINRYVNSTDPAVEASLDRFFGTKDWRTVRQAENRELASLAVYMNQLRAAGSFRYVTYTRILKPLQDRAYFHLVYATRNPTGILKFRDVERRTVREQDEVRAVAQREHREQISGQSEFAFEQETAWPPSFQDNQAEQLAVARQRLMAILQRGPIAYEELEPEVLQLPLVWHADFNRILMEGHKHGALVIQGLGRRERAPKRGNRIRLP